MMSTDWIRPGAKRLSGEPRSRPPIPLVGSRIPNRLLKEIPGNPDRSKGDSMTRSSCKKDKE